MFFQPERTAWDLNFPLFGVHVRVHPLFWLITAILGWSSMNEGGFPALLVWIACVFGSVLLHELGHVFMGRIFGTHGHIILYGMGGLAVGSSTLNNRWKRIAVYFAGPLVQLILAGIVFFIVRRLDPDEPLPPLLDQALFDLLIVNLFWPILNLMPIWPLDGGQISRDLCDWVSRENGIRFSLGLSIFVSGILAIQALAVHLKHPLPILRDIPFAGAFGGLYMAFFFASFAFNSYQALQLETARRRPWQDERDLWR